MHTYQFNQSVIDHVLQDEDPDIRDWGCDIVSNFSDYAKIVLSHGTRIEELRHELDGADYRERVMELDRQRTNKHNVCLGNVDMLNRFAKAENLAPFCDLGIAKDAKNVDRTDLGYAIVGWYDAVIQRDTRQYSQELGIDLAPYEAIVDEKSHDLVKDKTQFAARQTQVRNPDDPQTILENYNNLFRNNPYPMIYEKESEMYTFCKALNPKEHVSAKDAFKRSIRHFADKDSLNEDRYETITKAICQVDHDANPPKLTDVKEVLHDYQKTAPDVTTDTTEFDDDWSL